MNLQVNLSPADRDAINEQLVKDLATQFRLLGADVIRKHAYTVKEVAAAIGYKPDTVRAFIREGRMARSGQVHRLKARELTTGEYRILPADLDDFLLHF